MLHDLAQEFQVQDRTLSVLLLVVGSGAFGGLFVTALGDRIGRRPLLVGTTFGYALFTGLTATAQTTTQFVVYQFFARVFLVSELGVAITMIAEEYPPHRRARAVSTLTAFGGLGVVVLAGLYRYFAGTELGWRGLYMVGVVPLLLVGLLRFKLRETGAWLAARKEGVVRTRVPYREVLTGPYRREVVLLSAVYFFAHLGMIAAIAWFTLFAQRDRGFTPTDISTFMLVAYPLGMTGYVVAGRLLDRLGRRRTGVIFLLAGMVFGMALYQVPGKGAMFVFLILSVFFGLGMTPVLGAIAPELFPTEIRATAVAMARSVFGTLGATLGPGLAGILGDRTTGPLGSLANGVTVILLAYIPAAILLLRLPETRGRDLTHVREGDMGRAADVVSPGGP